MILISTKESAYKNLLESIDKIVEKRIKESVGTYYQYGKIIENNGDGTYDVLINGQTCIVNGQGYTYSPNSVVRIVVPNGNLMDRYIDSVDYSIFLTAADVSIPEGGWTSTNLSFSYTSADSPTFVMSVSGDYSTKFKAGLKWRLVQSSTTKYFIQSLDSTYNSSTGETSINLYGGTDYTLANSAISSVYISYCKYPVGFPADENKWSVTATFSGSVSGITVRTGKSIGSINLPVGAFNIYVNGYARWDSTANSEYDTAYYLSSVQDSSYTDIIGRPCDYFTLAGAGGLIRLPVSITIRNYKLTAKSTIYSTIFLYEPTLSTTYTGRVECSCKAVCAYL